MKRILLAGATLLALTAAQPALAADAPVYKGPPPVSAALFNWSGFYLGVNGGWARYQAYPGGEITCGGGTCVQPGANGWTLGGHIGYNWQAPGSVFVWGVEGDANWLDLSATAICGDLVSPCGTKVNWQASVRGRLGVAIAPMLLVYATGGIAFSELQGFASIFTDRSRRTGWIAGLGADWALNNNWFLGVEWLHADFGKADHLYDDVYPAIPLQTDQVRARLTFRP